MDQSDSDLDSEFWVSDDGSDYDDEGGLAPYVPRAEDATGFMLELTPEDEAGGEQIALLPMVPGHLS